MLPSNLYRQNRVRIERQASLDDGYGNTVDSWEVPLIVTTRWAAYRPQFGREAVEAGRLEATARGVLTLKRDGETLGITASDRVVFTFGAQSGMICQIRSINLTPDNREIEFVLEAGVAT
jgi:head-tail adaptor